MSGIAFAAVYIAAGLCLSYTIEIQDLRAIEKTSPKTIDRIERKEPLTLHDVAHLSKQKISAETIIAYMKEIQSAYNLTQPQIRQLQTYGVSQKVIDYMILSGLK